jgi:apolipoprotein N-acyltransferase
MSPSVKNVPSGGGGPSGRIAATARIAAAIAFAALWAYGAMRTAQVRDATARAPVVRVALVQPVIPPTVRWDEQNFGAIVDMLRVQTSAAMAEHVDLVVWSEGAFPYPLPTHASRDGAEAPAIVNARITAPILLGALAVDSEQHRFNAAFVREPDGTVSQPVAKRVLVPFGEYVPILGAIPWVRHTFHRVQGLTPGERPEVLRTRSGLELGVLNCFEDTLGYVAADARDANLLVNITNDAWFGRGAAPWQHLMLAQWRSIELRREMVRAVNTGVTGRVDALGHLVEWAPLWERATFIVDARELSLHTFAPYVIRFAPPFAVAVLALAMAESMRRARRERA